MKLVGIDIGALYLKGVRLDSRGHVATSFCRGHRGRPADVIEEALEALAVTADDRIAVTGCNGNAHATRLLVPYVDVTLCQVEELRRRRARFSYIMDIGGCSATLIQLNESGKLQGYTTNSLCAAGTGSFLDEQSRRLGVSYESVSDFSYKGEPPTIATRCAVFAKSDLIHLQQQGWSKAALWSGLCRGMTKTLLTTLLNGRPLDGKTAVIGGVALNSEVLRWLRSAYPELIVIPHEPHLIAAMGAAHKAAEFSLERLDADTGHRGARRTHRHIPVTNGKRERLPWPLTLEKSHFPSFETAESYVDADGNEVRVSQWPDGDEVRAFLGVDVGSTSTKLVLTDEEDRVLVDVYRKTAGDPVHAAQALFQALSTLEERKGSKIRVLGVGTTGSGRKIIGAVIGADLVINEISAHVAGASATDPTVETIFEIGGQDAKYMNLVDGCIRDANMNYVCAAGTGSFLEEQAQKLGYKVQEAGPAVLGVAPPPATDRCTVFMEQDLTKLIEAGASPQEAFAAVLVAVAKNYLQKVVGNRPRSREKIFFQGATARNPALVAAFERLLDVRVEVSPYCHVLGAYGTALLTRQRMREQGIEQSAFRGLDLASRDIGLDTEECTLCNNSCTITYAAIGGCDERPSWGYQCGRDPEETKVRVTPHARLLRHRQRLWKNLGKLQVSKSAPVIGIPQALATYTYLPLWRRFFNRLGYQVRLSGPTTEPIRELGSRLSGADFCFPAKVLLGHAATLGARDDVAFVFIPQMTNAPLNEHAKVSCFCPYTQASPAYTRAAFELNDMDAGRLLAPVVDLRLASKPMAQKLAHSLAGPLDRTRKQIQKAWEDALAVQRDFQSQCLEEGLKTIKEARRNNEPLVAIVGRPYNTFDQGLNLGLPEKLAEQGRTVLPMEYLPLDPMSLEERFRDLYWGYGRQILTALSEVAQTDGFDAVYLTNFGCGPDSFLLTYATEIMGKKPFLVLELDEHGADTGYMTRIEAFFDVLAKSRGALDTGAVKSTGASDSREQGGVAAEAIPSLQQASLSTSSAPLTGDERSAAAAGPAMDAHDYTIWIPNMHPFCTELTAAALRSCGLRSKALPLETKQSYEVGRAVTRGSECLPAALTIGSFLNQLRSNGKEKQALFMPTAQGPCRFGQYITLHRQILDREGFPEAQLVTPSHQDGFMGLGEPARRAIWKAILSGDILMKAGCKVRPYETQPGETDRRLKQELARVSWVLEHDGDLAEAIRRAMRNIFSTPHDPTTRKPLVGIVGEIYVRNNFFANETLIHSIEEYGAEAWSEPLSEWMLYTTSSNSGSNGNGFALNGKAIRAFLSGQWMLHYQRKLYGAASPYLDDRAEPHLEAVLEAGHTVLTENVGGEAILSVGRAIHFARQGASMVVNVAPFSCMPGTITAALFRSLSEKLELPITNLFYDGTGGQNERLGVFLQALLQEHGTQTEPEHAAPPRGNGSAPREGKQTAVLGHP
jgi:predicted CoA-substrate-specific enzyme activase